MASKCFDSVLNGAMACPRAPAWTTCAAWPQQCSDPPTKPARQYFPPSKEASVLSGDVLEDYLTKSWEVRKVVVNAQDAGAIRGEYVKDLEARVINCA